MSCRAISLVIAVFMCAAPASARAEDNDKGVVAVLPLTSSSTDLEIYSAPVAREVVALLKKKLSMRVEVISPSGRIPERVTLVVDGRIVGREQGKVMLTATVRDPAHGTREGTVSTRVRPRTEIDKLAGELGSLLAPVVKAAATRARAARPEGETNSNGSAMKPVTDLSGGDKDTEPVERTRDEPRTPVSDDPVVVVVPPSGLVANSVEVGPPSYGPMAAAMRRLGFSPVRSTRTGIVMPKDAAAEMSGAKADYALMIQLREVDFDWRGVLSARGRVRVLLVDRNGKPKFDRTVRTDTLVGSRGDRHAALVGFVAEQAIDIAYPVLRKVMR